MIWTKKSLCAFVAFLAVAVCGTFLALPTTQASAEVTTRTVPAEILFITKYNADRDFCVTRIYMQWAIQSDELPETVLGHYMTADGPGSRLFGYPYNDAPESVNNGDFTIGPPPPGFHWGYFGGQTASGGVGADCDEAEGKNRAYYRTDGATADVKVDVATPPATPEPSAACVEAQSTESKFERKVEKLKDRLQDAEGRKAKKRAKQKLKAARQELKEAHAATGGACA